MAILVSWVAIAVTSAAFADDRTGSSGRSHETHAVLGPRDSSSTSLGTTYASRPNDGTVQQNGNESSGAASHQHKALTFFRFNSKLGDVAVQPVVGTVKGAQLSISF